MTNDLHPFAFEDLPLNAKGQRIEPEAWGPKYTKPTKTAPVADRWPSACASGQKFDFDAAKYKAQMKARFAATAAADKRNWADGKLTIQRAGGFYGNIKTAYAQAMAAKRAPAAMAA